MDFNKIAEEMLELQKKIEIYQIRNNKLKDLLTLMLKELSKLQKKYDKETDELNKMFIQISIIHYKKFIGYLEKIYKDAVEDLDNKAREK